MGRMKRKITEYIESLDAQDISQNTAVSYRRDLCRLSEYLEAQGQQDCLAVTETMLRDYVRHMEGEQKSPATISRSIASMKAFFRYLVQTGEIAQNPAVQLKAPRIEKCEPHILTPEEVALLLRQPDGKTAKSIRDGAMLELLYATGIRVSELVRLELSDLNISMEYIVCRQGKGERVIPFGKTAKKSLQAYLESARPALVTDPACRLLFTNLSGQQMSRQGFWKILKKYGREAGIQGELTPHTLRHSFAAHLVNNGADLYAVQEMMGYSDLSAAQIYAKMRHAPIREVYTKAHPRE